MPDISEGRIEVPEGDLTDAQINEISVAVSRVYKEYVNATYPPTAESRKMERNDWPGNLQYGVYDYLFYNRSWKVDKGDIAGLLPKRVATWIRKNKYWPEEPKLRESIQTTLANIGAKFGPIVNSGKKYNLWVQKQMDWDAGAWGDQRSCFWTERKYNKNDLNKHPKFHALCLECDGVKGRALLWDLDLPNDSNGLPVKGWMVFNAYGFQLLTASRVLATALGYTYHQVPASGSEGIYLNNNACYVVLPFGTKPAAQYVLECRSAPPKPRCRECGGDPCLCRFCPECGALERNCRHCDRCDRQACRCTCCMICETDALCPDCGDCRECGDCTKCANCDSHDCKPCKACSTKRKRVRSCECECAIEEKA